VLLNIGKHQVTKQITKRMVMLIQPRRRDGSRASVAAHRG